MYARVPKFGSRCFLGSRGKLSGGGREDFGVSGVLEEGGKGVLEGLEVGDDFRAAFAHELGEAGEMFWIGFGEFGQSEEDGEGVTDVVFCAS